MKSVYKLCFSALLGILLCFVCITTAHAFNEIDSVSYDGSGFEVGDSIVYYCRNQYADGGFVEVYVRNGQTVFQDGYDKYMCFYLEENSSTNGGYSMRPYNVIGFTESYYNAELENTFVNEAVGYGGQDVPWEYMDNGEMCTSTVAFFTNIPIFPDKATADAYRNGEDVSTQAINYNKEYSGGSWVKPFEDIVINDSDILVPDLSNISHTGFTVTNCKDERYLVEIYMESGLEKPENFMNNSRNVEDALFINAFGLITDNSEAYYNGPTFDMAQLYGIDNYTALMNSINSFYTTYPSGNSYPVNEKASNNYFIWGKPFGKIGAFFSNGSKVSADELLLVTPADVPICYTQYKVRYFYYDDFSGYHYGPWGVYTYFSDGNVVKSSIFQSNTGDIISTPGINGSQDSDGNIGYSDDTNYVDLNNPNELFGYIRSVFNNVSSTMGNFSILFGSVFNFLPAEILALFFLGMAVMVLVGVIRIFT